MAAPPSAAALSAAELQVSFGSLGWSVRLFAIQCLKSIASPPPRPEVPCGRSCPQGQRPVPAELLASASGILAASAMTIGGHRG